MKTFFHYALVYWQYFELNAAKALSFRANFAFLFLLDLCFYFSNVFTYQLLVKYMPSFNGWQTEQYMFYVGFVLLVDWLHMFFIGSAHWQFSFLIRQGQLDFFLLRPLHPLFSSFASHIRFDCLFNLIPCLSLLIYFGIKAKLSLLSWCLLPFVAILSVSLIAMVEMTMMLWLFWLKEAMGLQFFRMQMHHMARWPDFFYRKMARAIFLIVLPALLYFSPFVRFLIDFKDFELLILAIVLILFWFLLLNLFWSYSIKNYESASS